MIEQALYGTDSSGGRGFLAVSPGFRAEWKPFAEKLCAEYGDPVPGSGGATALFAFPLCRGQVAIIEVLGGVFRILVLPTLLYEDLGADPFWIAEQCPAPWTARELPALPIPQPVPERTTALLRPILQRDDSAVYLGGVQALLDGSRLVLARPGPAPDLVRGLWMLLPLRSRADMWPCTFTPRPRPEFHVQVTPIANPHWSGALTEDQAADYPEGRYELALQSAVETGDEGELARLLARRSRRQMLWLAVALLLLFSIIPIAAALTPVPVPKPEPKAVPAETKK